MSKSEEQTSESEPRLRHEFVGMMFAVTIGEVGLQAAALVQAPHPAYLLRAYSHLILATVVIATSWVGWSRSAAPGARKDVQVVFQWEFAVLLLDVSLVITYFILVRTVDFGKEDASPRIDPASTVAFLILLIFFQYFLWDVVTKVFISWRDRDTATKKKWREHFDQSWRRSVGSRMLPTVACLILVVVTWLLVRSVNPPPYLALDFSLLWLVLLFRALKEVISAYFPSPPKAQPSKPPMSKTSAVRWSVACGMFVLIGILWTLCRHG